jgi:glycosidase
MAYPGAPAVYYGDEVGLKGDKDPDCRRAFPWDRQDWVPGLRDLVQELIHIRRERPELRRGAYQRICLDQRRGCYAFARTLGKKAVLVVMNAGATRRHVRFSVSDLGWKDGRIVEALLDRQEYIVSGDELSLTLDPWSARWIA